MARRKTSKPDDAAGLTGASPTPEAEAVPPEAAPTEATAPAAGTPPLAAAAAGDGPAAAEGSAPSMAATAPMPDDAAAEPATSASPPKTAAETAKHDEKDSLLAHSGREAVIFLNRFTRFPRIRVSRAAAIAVAAGLGAVLGSLTASGIAGLASRGDADPHPVMALQESVRSLAVEVRALKESADAANRAASAELAKLAARLDQNDQTQAGIAGAIGRIASSLDGSAVSSETTGSIAPAAKPDTAQGWVLWRVRDGRALVSGKGGYYEVVPGSRIPGLGLVQKITREDGRWVVTTQTGTIVAPPG